MTDRFETDDDPKGPGYDRLAELARRTRPQAPPELVDRVMRAVRLEPGPPRPVHQRILALLGGNPFRLPRLAGAGAMALVLVLVLVAILGRNAVEPRNDAPASDMVLHRFELEAPDARKVCLVGNFNGWEVCRTPLVRNVETGEWSLEVPLPPGRHEYMFVLDDESWVTDPEAPVHVDDGFGNVNAVVFL